MKIIALIAGICMVFTVALAPTSTAEVSSANVVGVLNMELPPGLSLVSTPLVTIGEADLQTLDDVFGDQLPDLSEVHFFGGAGYVTYRYFNGEWYDSAMQPGAGSTALERGDGFWVKNPNEEPVAVQISGQVPESGKKDVELPAGLRLVSYAFPIDSSSPDWAGDLNPDDLDEIHLFDTSVGYITYRHFAGTWYDSAMNESDVLITPGSAFWYDSQSEKTWSQSSVYTLD